MAAGETGYEGGPEGDDFSDSGLDETAESEDRPRAQAIGRGLVGASFGALIELIVPGSGVLGAALGGGAAAALEIGLRRKRHAIAERSKALIEQLALRLGMSQTELLEQLSGDEAAFSVFLTFLKLAEREREQWTIARGCEVFAAGARDDRIIDHAELVLEALAKLRPLETRLIRVLSGERSRPQVQAVDEGEPERDRTSLPVVDETMWRQRHIVEVDPSLGGIVEGLIGSLVTLGIVRHSDQAGWVQLTRFGWTCVKGYESLQQGEGVQAVQVDEARFPSTLPAVSFHFGLQSEKNVGAVVIEGDSFTEEIAREAVRAFLELGGWDIQRAETAVRSPSLRFLPILLAGPSGTAGTHGCNADHALKSGCRTRRVTWAKGLAISPDDPLIVTSYEAENNVATTQRVHGARTPDEDL